MDVIAVPIEFITGYCKMVVVTWDNVSVGIDGSAARLRAPIVFRTILKLIWWVHSTAYGIMFKAIQA